MTRQAGRLWLTGACTAVVLACAAEAFRLGFTARVAPLSVAILTLALLAVEWRSAVRTPAATGRSTAPATVSGREELAVAAWLCALLAVTLGLGMVAGPPVYVLLYLRQRAGRGWRLSLAIPLGLWVLLHAGVQELLGVRLFDGLLWRGTLG